MNFNLIFKNKNNTGAILVTINLDIYSAFDSLLNFFNSKDKRSVWIIDMMNSNQTSFRFGSVRLFEFGKI